MSDVYLPIENGKVTENTATNSTGEKKNTRGTTDLGYDAFLKLLIAEMQHQDPLEPTTNTEWISQMATFSQLEELQSLSATTENTQIFSLVGKYAVVATKDVNGDVQYKEGIVDFISMSGGKAKFSINGVLYSMDELFSVMDGEYIYDKSKPSLVEKVEFNFNGDKPEDLQFKVTMGENAAKATEVAILVGNAIIDSNYVTLTGDTVTVKQEILQELEQGTYKFAVVFNDEQMTTVEDMLTVNIYNSHPTVKEETEAGTSEGENAEGTEAVEEGV